MADMKKVYDDLKIINLYINSLNWIWISQDFSQELKLLQCTIKSRVVDQSTIQFLTIWDVLLTES